MSSDTTNQEVTQTQPSSTAPAKRPAVVVPVRKTTATIKLDPAVLASATGTPLAAAPTQVLPTPPAPEQMVPGRSAQAPAPVSATPTPAVVVPVQASKPSVQASVAQAPQASTPATRTPQVLTPVAQAQVPQAQVPQTQVPQAQGTQAQVSQAQGTQASVPQAPAPQAQVPQAQVPVVQTPAPVAPVSPAPQAKVPATNAPAATVERTLGGLLKKLESVVSNSLSRREMFESSLAEIAKHFDAFWGLLEFQADGRTVTREFKSREMNTSELVDYAYTLSVDAQMDARSKGRAIPSGEGDYAAISSPILDPHSDAVLGTMTFFTRLESPEKAKQMVREVERAIATICALKPDVPNANSRIQSKARNGEMQAFLGAAKYDDVRGLCYALVNSYCQKLGCQLTAIGLVEANQVKLYAISGLETIMENSPAIVNIRQAQEECLDQNQRVIVQQPTNETAAKGDGFLIHQRWHQQANAAAVASFPIQIDGENVAIFSFERNLTEPFTDEEADKIEETIQSFGPAIKVMKRSNRSLRTHISEQFRDGFVKRFKSKVVSISALLALAFFVLGWLPYRPTVPCTIEPAKVNHLIAPYDGVIASADLFAGDKIVAGQPILKFDTRDLELERDSILATMRSKEVERNMALAEREKATAMVINAEVDALAVQLESIKRKISQGVMCAQYDGEIISGDLRHQIGQVVPKGTSLIQVAPTEGMRIELQIPESKAALIQPGYEGYFSSSARPSDRHKFKITKVTPATTVVDGQNVVLAEAEVSGDSEWLRTGMTGYANVRAGWQPVWWMTTHGIIDRLRLGFWL